MGSMALLKIVIPAVCLGHACPLLTGVILVALGLWAVRLHPRKTLDMSWLDLLASFKACFTRRDRQSVEKQLQQILSPEEIVTLSVRSAFDLLLSALDLPRGSEVLFVPGITIPAMVQLVELHGLQPVGVDPLSPQQMLPSQLEPFVTTQTRVVIISHLFGTIHKAGHLIREAKDLGLLVVEDCNHLLQISILFLSINFGNHGAVLVKAMSAPPRAEGVDFCRAHPLDLRLDGAVLVTGATGFVGGGILFSLLSRAEELGLTKIVLMVRRRAGKTVEERLQKLKENSMFDGLRETFDQLVVGLEGDVSQQNFGWKEHEKSWPHQERLKAVLHCAGDVRFQQPMQQAAVSLVSATLQVQQLASQWRSKRFLFVSTAFVHAVPPSSTEALEEKLVELRDFDAMELYRDAMSHGSWAKTAMRELGFPNTYTFAKAIAEHLVIRACEADELDVRIVRPSIVGPSWAFPYTGWAGDKPSTIVGAGALLARRGVRVFRDGFDHPCPVVPVDMVADLTVRALCGASNAEPGFALRLLFQIFALKGILPLFELGFMSKLLRASSNATVFYYANSILNVFPIHFLDAVRICLERIFSMFGQKLSKEFSTVVRVLVSCRSLPMDYHPFSSPSTPWRFKSCLRLAEEWDLFEYVLICGRAAYAFALNPLQGPERGYAKEFSEIRICSKETAMTDALLAFVHPEASIFYSIAAFVVRLGLSWISLTVTVDGTSLSSITSLDAPLVLCPQHRSVLDFVIIGLMCSQLQPLLPLHLPHVAADAEFSNLPVLGWALSGLGAFFVRRGGGAVQPDPALRAKVGRVFQSGRPLEVFLEGLRLKDELPPVGEAFMRFGAVQTLAASSDLDLVVSAVQKELVADTRLSTLHCRALSEFLQQDMDKVVKSIQKSLHASSFSGFAERKSLKKHGVTMGMEPDSMELSTLGGWIATRASGMKRARYGNIEDMVLEVRLITPGGAIWQRHGDPKAQAETAIGRASTNIGLPAMVLGSEGCLGVITSAVVRVRPLPQVVEYQSVVFPDWDRGASWMREVARMPAGLRPASCRLMDQNQLQLAQALKQGSEEISAWQSLRNSLKDAFLHWKGISLEDAAAVTLVFEGHRAEVNLQKKEISKLVSMAGGLWGGASAGSAGYTLTFAIAYLRDFGLDYRILSESLETMVPWSTIHEVWPAVKMAVQREHRQLRLPGKPFMSCRMTQLYDEGGVLYMYLAICTTGLEAQSALAAFESLEHAARCAILNAGGCLSHHHGVGKLRASLLPETQSLVLTQALRNFKMALDPSNVLAARNGTWCTTALEGSDSQSLASDAHEFFAQPKAMSWPTAFCGATGEQELVDEIAATLQKRGALEIQVLSKQFAERFNRVVRLSPWSPYAENRRNDGSFKKWLKDCGFDVGQMINGNQAGGRATDPTDQTDLRWFQAWVYAPETWDSGAWEDGVSPKDRV
eukprot:g29910.t1